MIDLSIGTGNIKLLEENNVCTFDMGNFLESYGLKA